MILFQLHQEAEKKILQILSKEKKEN